MNKKYLFSDARFPPSESGFTLVEMAVVLVVIGLIILTVFPALNAVRMSSQRSASQSNLQALMLATAAYVQANGCFPCPTPAATVGNGFGRVRGDSSASPVPCGTCANAEGIAPFMSLGLPIAVALDGWGHWITMRVDPALTGSSANFTVAVPPAAPCQCSDFVVSSLPAGCSSSQASSSTTPNCATLNASQKGLCRTGISAANRISVQTLGGSSQQAAVVFVSHGANGYGSFVASAVVSLANGAQLPFPSSMPSCANGGYARCNAALTTQFVNASASVNSTNPYDDLLAYADRNTLVSMFGNGSCQTVW